MSRDQAGGTESYLSRFEQRREAIYEQQKRSTKLMFRQARGHAFRRAWNLGVNIFEHLEAAGLNARNSTASQLTEPLEDNPLGFRALEVMTATPSLPKNDTFEMRAVQIERSLTPTTLGRLALRKAQPPVTKEFRLEMTARDSYTDIWHPYAILEHRDQQEDRIFFSVGMPVLATREDHYDFWSQQDTELLEDFSLIDQYLRTRIPKES